MKKILLVIAIMILALALTQCSKRENPVDVEQPHGLFWGLYFESEAIQGDIMEDYWLREILVYTPPGYNPEDTTTKYPVLYLLHGYGGTHTYFQGLFDLGDVMDELIGSGEIEPMIVATPNATNNLGGSFYTNSPAFNAGQSYAGRMQDFITEEVVHVIDSVFHTVPDRAHRGIAGHSMGGYGAVKLAMLRSDLFGSAASMSGPLAFWGTNPVSPDFDGILEFLDYMCINENGFNPRDTLVAGDTAAFHRISPGPGKRITNMMFAMGSAFSPHDPADTDTSLAHYFNTGLFRGYIDLPFDVRGQLAPSIWNLWMANDVTALFGVLGGAFDSTALYVDAGADDDLVLDIQAQVFAQVAGARIDQFEIYPGVPGLYPASHTGLIHERLKKVVKFHNGAFGN